MRLPRLVQTVRFRLTVLYSLLLFGLAALVVAGIYGAVSRSVGDEPVAKSVTVMQGVVKPDGTFKPLRDIEVVSDVEQVVNAKTLDTLRRYSAWTLGALLVSSLAIGWVLSGRALPPLRQIAQSAEHVQATDLSRRIRLTGPDDEFRHLADTIDSMLARLDDAFLAQRQLLDEASHELRNPLAIIQLNTDGVLLADDTTEAERRDAALVVSRASRRMTGLVEDLLAAARRNAPAFSDTDVDLVEVARDAEKEYAVVAGQRGQRLRLVQRGGPALVQGDHDGLRRAVANLLSNAVRFAPPGSTVTLGAGSVGTWCWLAVADAGPGIHAGDRDRVFDRFWRGPGDEGRRGGHAGLGLSIVRQIVEGHRGAVRVLSEPGRGATFVLWLPARGAGAPDETPPAGDPLAVSPDPTPPTIMQR